MARKVFLHLGAPKTGTTYLQELMGVNRDALMEQGVLYADGKYPQDRVWATEVLRGHDLSSHPRPQAAHAWDRLVEQVRGWDGDAVISHEFFGVCSAEQALRAHRDLAPAELHLVFTARDYVRQASAVWQERLKYGWTTPLAEFSLTPGNGSRVWSWRSQDVVAVLDRWQHDLPASNVHVVTVPPSGGPKGALWERFASVIGVDPASCHTELPMVNSSLGLAEAELLRRVDERVVPEIENPRERAKWIRDVLANRVLVPGLLGEVLRAGEHGRAAHRPGAQGGQAAGRAPATTSSGPWTTSSPSPAATPTRLPEDLTSEELLDAAVNAITGLLLETKAMSDRHAERSRRMKDRLATAVLQGRTPAAGRPWHRLFNVARQKESGTDRTAGPA